MKTHQSDRWINYFLARGHPAVAPLGSGVEGVVYDLGGNLVGKVWFKRNATSLLPTREFQRDLCARELPFATPLITDVSEVDGCAVTTEHRLPGTPLRALLQREQIPLAAAYEATLTAVTGLAATEAGPAARALAVLDETAALWAGHDSWTGVLAALVRRRAQAYGGVLRGRVNDFDWKLARTLALLEQVPSGPDQIVHGDLCPENILVDDRFRVVAVIDWSFLTTAGDHTFEAAVAAGIFDMYGPGARASDDALTLSLARDHGHSPDRLLLYRAAYAIATANAFSEDGSDGHFAWCASSLERPDVIELLSSDSPDF